MKYLDLVELIKDKPDYEKAGIKKGMFGAVISEKPINEKSGAPLAINGAPLVFIDSKNFHFSRFS